MNKSLLMLAIAAACTAVPASAATIITFAGNVTGGTDGIGLFGTPGADLAGQTFDLTFTLADITPGFTVDDTYAWAGWYSSWSQPNPLSAVLTIGGHSYGYTGATYTDIQYSNDAVTVGGFYDEVYYGLGDGDTYAWAYVNNHTGDITSSASFTSPIDYAVKPTDGAGGMFRVASRAGGETTYTKAILSPLTLKVAPSIDIPAVPEPATWMLMLAGFAAVGTATRRSRSRRRVSIAYA